MTIHAVPDDSLVTLIDIVSPTNKLTEIGRAAYLKTRKEARDVGANVVEVDLVLRGTLTLPDLLRGLPPFDYAVTVTRNMEPERHEIYTASLAKRLPRFRLPLALDDRDIVGDMQEVFSQAYDACEFGTLIDYQKLPDIGFSSDVQERVVQILKEPRAD